jgi:hypothetical protein
MSNEFVLYEHHGAKVMVRAADQGQHRDHCLCYACVNFHPDEDHNCPMAQAFYRLCVQFNMVTPVWECPAFVESRGRISSPPVIPEGLTRKDLTGESARRYLVYAAGELIFQRVFQSPVAVFCGPGHAFHRVLGVNGDVTLVPAPGPVVKDGKIVGFCLVAWTPKDLNSPVQS